MCSFDSFLQDNPQFKISLDDYLVSYALNPRDAFGGGRTNNIVTYYEVKEWKKIKYIDICSLYSCVCKTGKFPIGHSKVYVSNDCKNLTGFDKNLDNVAG